MIRPLRTLLGRRRSSSPYLGIADEAAFHRARLRNARRLGAHGTINRAARREILRRLAGAAVGGATAILLCFALATFAGHG